MHYKAFLIFFFLSWTFVSSSQVIQAIEFEGLSKTKPVYLLQFVESKKGAEMDSITIEGDRQRLTNLSMFSNVLVETDNTDDGVIVKFQCQEIQTLLPILNFGGIKENFWFQVGASEVNLAGKGNQLSAYYQYYDRSSFNVHMVMERIGGSKWGSVMNLVRWRTVEPLFFPSGTGSYEYTNNTIGLGALYHFNFHTKLELSSAYFTEEYSRLDSQEIPEAPQTAETHKQLVKTILRTDRRNYHFYLINGFCNQLNVEAVYSFDGDPDFYITFNELKLFQRLGKYGNNAVRLRMGISSNQAGPFAPFVLDSYLNIRGVGNRVDRGTAMIILNEEYRQTIMDYGNLALQGVVFTDFGTWRSPGGSISDLRETKNFEWYAGGGLRFIHKKFYNAIFRIDYAIDVQTPYRNGFVIGLGQYF